jgi:hypothetical protein
MRCDELLVWIQDFFEARPPIAMAVPNAEIFFKSLSFRSIKIIADRMQSALMLQAWDWAVPITGKNNGSLKLEVDEVRSR